MQRTFTTAANDREPVRVLVVDDHALFAEALMLTLGIDDRIQVVGSAASGTEAVSLAQALHPDVILMDIAMPVLNGLEATRQILTANPAARIVILSAHTDHAYIERMTAAGVSGFLEKQTSAEILTKAIREVAAGKTYFSPSIAKHLPRIAYAVNQEYRSKDTVLRDGDEIALIPPVSGG